MARDSLDEPLGDFEDDWEEPPRPRGFTMRNPVMLVLVLAGSVFMLVKYWPRVDYMISARTPLDCGDVTERPILRKDDPASLPALPHDAYCQLAGVVQTFTILATGEPKEGSSPKRRNEGRKYYVKLDGDKVFAVLAADRNDIIKFRARRGSLLGFAVREKGRMIDPDLEPGYGPTARTLRVKFAVPEGAPLRIFDTTDVPSSRWPAAVGSAFLLLTSLLALFGLVRLVRRRLSADDEELDALPDPPAELDEEAPEDEAAPEDAAPADHAPEDNAPDDEEAPEGAADRRAHDGDREPR